MENDQIATYLDEKTIRAVASTLKESPQRLDRELAYYLDALLADHAIALPPRPIVALGSALEMAESESRGLEDLLHCNISFPTLPLEWGQRFIIEMFDELRRIICGNRRTPSKIGKHSEAALTALAAIVMHKLGVTNSTALGFAVLIFLSLSQASKKAFCRMTTKEELKKLLEELDKGK